MKKILLLVAVSFCAVPCPAADTAQQQQSYLIRSVAREHGTISPSGWVAASAGSSQTFTITPDAGYRVRDVRVNWMSQGPIKTYTFTNVQKRHRIVAAFVKDEGQNDFSSALPIDAMLSTPMISESCDSLFMPELLCKCAVQGLCF
jgi:hypothetical protein